MLRDLSNVDGACLDVPTIDRLRAAPSAHPPRILLLYGSLRERSYSRFLTLEAERLLKHFGAETRIDSATLNVKTDADQIDVRLTQPVADLREGGAWPVRVQAQGQLQNWPPRLAVQIAPTRIRSEAAARLCARTAADPATARELC